MRDFAVIALLIFSVIYSLYKPWLSVLFLAFFSYANPHRYAWGFATHFPVFQILVIAAFVALLKAKDRQPVPMDWRVLIFYMLWIWFFITTVASPIGWAAWPKLWEVSKVYIPLILTLVLINNREKLFWLLTTIGFSFGLLAAKGGLFAITRGFHYRVWGPDGTMYGGNNEFSIATLASIPLLVLTARRLKGASDWRRWLRILAILIIPLAIASAISSWSRGGALTLAALVLVLWWHSKKKLLLSVLIIGAVLAAPNFLPSEWFARMGTIENYQEDASAMGRITAWTDGLRFLADHPILGAGFDGWRYVTKRDWHSSYVEILVEHGVPGAVLWGLLLIGTIINLTKIIKLSDTREQVKWAKDFAIMLRASLIAYSFGSLTLGITYWDLFYQLVFCSILLNVFVKRELSKLVKVSAFSPKPSVNHTFNQNKQKFHL